MKKSDRHNYILQLVQESDDDILLSTKDLAEHFDVSETTIRRDFQELAANGLLERQHGGAHSVKSLSNTQLGTVGILLGSRVDKYLDPFYNLVIEGADKKLNELGYHVSFIKTYNDIHSIARVDELLDQFHVDGLILLGSSKAESINYLRQHFSPIVTVTEMNDIEDDSVFFDGIRGMRLIVEHLAELGYRRLGYISGQIDLRYEGFIQTIKACGLEFNPELYQILTPSPSGWSPEMGRTGANILMSQAIMPDAIVCASDRIAIGTMQWLQQNGYRIPQDIAVTGFDDIYDAEFTFPPLTTVHVHKVRMGKIVAERIVRRIQNPNEIYLKIIVPTSLVVRKSSLAKET